MFYLTNVNRSSYNLVYFNKCKRKIHLSLNTYHHLPTNNARYNNTV